MITLSCKFNSNTSKTYVNVRMVYMAKSNDFAGMNSKDCPLLISTTHIRQYEPSEHTYYCIILYTCTML